MPNLEQNLRPWYKLLRKDVEFALKIKHLKNFEVLKKVLLQATQTTPSLAKPCQQYVILCDAIYYSSGFVLMIEDYLYQKRGTKEQAFAPVSFGSQSFNTSQPKMSTYCAEVLTIYFAIGYSLHLIWGAEKPVIVLTDKKSLTIFFSQNRFIQLYEFLWTD